MFTAKKTPQKTCLATTDSFLMVDELYLSVIYLDSIKGHGLL